MRAFFRAWLRVELSIIGVLAVGGAVVRLTSPGREPQSPPVSFESEYSGIVIRLTDSGCNPFVRLDVRVKFPDGEPA